jgi:hypothetical protein
MRACWFVLLATVPTFFLTGCGGSYDGKVPVAGTITIKGEPVPEGTINFASANPTQSVFTGSLIKNGRYDIAAENGLPPGQYVVRISSAEPGVIAHDPLPGETGPPMKDRVPPEYNANSKLTVSVEPGRKHTFDFDVP